MLLEWWTAGGRCVFDTQGYEDVMSPWVVCQPYTGAARLPAESRSRFSQYNLKRWRAGARAVLARNAGGLEFCCSGSRRAACT
jgi:hypothetical protein